MAQALLLKAPEPDKPRTADEAMTHMNGRRADEGILLRGQGFPCFTDVSEKPNKTHKHSVWPLSPNFY